jgi:hypothetical protein
MPVRPDGEDLLRFLPDHGPSSWVAGVCPPSTVSTGARELGVTASGPPRRKISVQRPGGRNEGQGKAGPECWHSSCKGRPMRWACRIAVQPAPAPAPRALPPARGFRTRSWLPPASRCRTAKSAMPRGPGSAPPARFPNRNVRGSPQQTRSTPMAPQQRVACRGPAAHGGRRGEYGKSFESVRGRRAARRGAASQAAP